MSELMSDEENDGLTHAVSQLAWLLKGLSGGKKQTKFDPDLVHMITTTWKDIQKELQDSSGEFRIFRV